MGAPKKRHRKEPVLDKHEVELTLPSGFTITTTNEYRFVLAVDAREASWIDTRTDDTRILNSRVRKITSDAMRRRSFVFDLKADKRIPASELKGAQR